MGVLASEEETAPVPVDNKAHASYGSGPRLLFSQGFPADAFGGNGLARGSRFFFFKSARTFGFAGFFFSVSAPFVGSFFF